MEDTADPEKVLKGVIVKLDILNVCFMYLVYPRLQKFDRLPRNVGVDQSVDVVVDPSDRVAVQIQNGDTVDPLHAVCVA
jgi:hypothetical protein